MANQEIQPTILVVDDEPANIDVLRGILSGQYKIKVATNGVTALRIAQTSPVPDLILLDVMMPDMDGFEVCEKLKGDHRTFDIPVVFVTTLSEVDDESKGFDIGASDYITKPVSPPIVTRRVKNLIQMHNQQAHLQNQVRERTEELETTRMEIILRLGRAAEYKDNETGMHVKRMSLYAYVLARARGLSEREALLLKEAAPMHDIGKIGIPDRILLKPGKLDAKEWEIMQTHSQIGAEILGDYNSVLINAAREVALTHHEKWNGTGYPNGLAREQIPLFGRITTIADVFDALTTERPYKKGWTVGDATGLLKQEKGQHFDPDLVDLFLANLPEIEEIRMEFAEPAD